MNKSPSTMEAIRNFFRILRKKSGIVTNRELSKRIEIFESKINNLTCDNDRNSLTNSILRNVEWHVVGNRLILSEIFRNSAILYNDLSKILEKHNINLASHNNQISLKTDYNIASNSNDHIFPESTTEGMVRHPKLVKKAKELFGENMSFLDIGCGGGALVFDFAIEGILSIGLDGSDTCLKSNDTFWNLLPKNFFTCDITQEFSLIDSSKEIKRFDLISSWEVLEHIPESGLNQMLKNIHNHLSEKGYFIGTVSMLEYSDPKTGVVYHVTLENKEWWINIFRKNGLIILDTNDNPFHFNDFYRGVGGRYQDLHNYSENPNSGFQFVATKN